MAGYTIISDLLQFVASVPELFVMDGIFKRATHLVQVLVGFQFFLLFLKCGEPLLNVAQHLLNLLPLCLCTDEDSYNTTLHQV